MTKKTTKPAKSATKKKAADQYDRGDYNYLHYWRERDYEHAAEELAITRLLKGKHFKTAVDIGGGYGRLCVALREYADEVTLAEPSKKQLEIAEEFLKDHPKIKSVRTQADKLTFADKSFDLITMIRVMHHLPDPSKEFAELERVLADEGYLILEVANYAHGRNRVKHAMRGKKLPLDPVDIRSRENQNDDEPAFVNHNPKTVIKQLAHAGLKVEKTLSVSNLRSPGLKKIVPKSAMLSVEKFLQKPLAKTYFGPSVFFLVRKAR
ncbi:MAG: class I SAM-dependent methyltransferase [Candidatus Saccharibacteria bacterium]|nr:class I SAM-dependent methyltransferase [Candidatus Saccharibacteria bacterium]